MFEGMSKTKTPYTPSETKRYEIALDEFSQKRIHALHDIYRALKTELGVPLSFSIYGSLAKGKTLTAETAQNADIDMYVDLDSENLPQKIKAKKMKKMVIKKLQEVKEKLGYKKIPRENIDVRILDKKSIENALLNLEIALDMTTAIENLLFSGNPRDYEIYLASFFTLTIGPTASKYRNAFLAELATKPNKTEAKKTWQTISRVIGKTERIQKHGYIPKEIVDRFPHTLEEALTFYGVKTSDTIKP